MPGARRPEARLLPPLLLLPLLLLGPGFPEPSSRPYSALVVPRRMESRDAAQSEAELSYALLVEGKRTVVRLKRISFVTSNMPVYSYNLEGDLITDYPYIKDNCYYSGFVEGAGDSQAVLSTCRGLWGHLHIGTSTYEIKPVENSGTFQHLIYRTAPRQQEPCRRGPEAGVELARAAGRPESGSPSPPSRNVEELTSAGYLEYYAVVDRSKFIAEKRNETDLVILVLQMMANVHTMFLGIGLRIYLVGLELWTQRDYITISPDSLNATLADFHSYVTRELRHRVRFDHAGLITSRGSPFGLAWGERSCASKPASASAMRSEGDLLSDGLNVAHQLGHSLGFGHDDAPEYAGQNCDCGCGEAGKCAMVAALSDVKCHRLSNCSRRLLQGLLRQPGKDCLRNSPPAGAEPEVRGVSMVGEDGVCDCGLDERCRRDGLPTPGPACPHGPCCRECQFLKSGTVCRDPASECDLPEFCSGTSAACPPDVHKQDGMPCGSAGTCYRRSCLSLQEQCAALFGPGAQLAPLICFKEVNVQGDRSGNCGQEGALQFKKCPEEDAPCGRVQCTHVGQIRGVPAGHGIVQTSVGDTLCWGTAFHRGKDADDLGAVRDGTSCGVNKICINRSCVDRSVLRYDCDFSKCNNRGLCNSKRNCHCRYGWAPPFCERSGFGGSVDSGPPPPARGSLVPLGTVLLLAGLLLLLALLCFAILRREQLADWWLAGGFWRRRPPSSPPFPVSQVQPSKSCLVLRGEPSKGALLMKTQQSRVTFAM